MDVLNVASFARHKQVNEMLNVKWLMHYYHLVTASPTFKSTVCGGNAKQI